MVALEVHRDADNGMAQDAKHAKSERMNGCPIPLLRARIIAKERPIVCARLIELHRRSVSEGKQACNCRRYSA
jgi:hypothetical protein